MSKCIPGYFSFQFSVDVRLDFKIAYKDSFKTKVCVRTFVGFGTS